MQQKRLPIGYYLKLADSVLTKGIDDIQAQHGLDRISWQILNSIYENPNVLEAHLLELMEPLAEKKIAQNVLSKFIDEGQIDLEDNRLTLNPEGSKIYNAYFKTQQEFRNKAMTEISNDDYQTTISTLEKIITNTNSDLK